MLFFEADRSDQPHYLYCQQDRNLNFPLHLHHSLEFLCVQSGALACTIGENRYRLNTGEALLVLPDQLHSYETPVQSQSILWVFSVDWVSEFMAAIGHNRFSNPVFEMQAQQVMELLWPGNNSCKQKAGLYLICGTALEQCPQQPVSLPESDLHLSAQIIDYVQHNYTHALSLEQMARELGYNYTYLSAYLNQNLHTNFLDFVNQYRVSHATALLQGSNLPITQVAEQCGFGTIRSFNRVFLKYKGVTPSAFRNQNRP